MDTLVVARESKDEVPYFIIAQEVRTTHTYTDVEALLHVKEVHVPEEAEAKKEMKDMKDMKELKDMIDPHHQQNGNTTSTHDQAQDQSLHHGLDLDRLEEDSQKIERPRKNLSSRNQTWVPNNKHIYLYAKCKKLGLLLKIQLSCGSTYC